MIITKPPHYNLFDVTILCNCSSGLWEKFPYKFGLCTKLLVAQEFFLREKLLTKWHKKCHFLWHFNLTRTESVISNDAPFKDGNVQFATVPLKTLIWSKNFKDIVVFLTLQVYISVGFFIATYKQEKSKSLSQTQRNRKWKGTKTLKPNSYLSRHSFQGYRCKSDITIFAGTIIWIYANTPFKSDITIFAWTFIWIYANTPFK